MERAIADADQPVDAEVHRIHRAADFAVLAFTQADCQPGVCPLLTVQRHGHGLKPFPVDGDALAQRFQGGIGRASVHPHPVAAQPAGAGQLQFAFHTAVIGQQQQPLGVQVEAPHRHHTGQVFGQGVIDRAAPLFVARGGHQPGGFVIEPDARRFGFRDRFAVYGDLIRRGDVQRRGENLCAVHPHTARFDHPFGLAARGDAGT